MTPKQTDADEARAWAALNAVMGNAGPDEDLVDEDDTSLSPADAPVGQTAPGVVATLEAEGRALIEGRWRDLLAAARTRGATPPRPPLSTDLPRAELLARLADLQARYPALTAHHRNLIDASDDLLRAMIEDIEAVTDGPDDE